MVLHLYALFSMYMGHKKTHLISRGRGELVELGIPISLPEAERICSLAHSLLFPFLSPIQFYFLKDLLLVPSCWSIEGDNNNTKRGGYGFLELVNSNQAKKMESENTTTLPYRKEWEENTNCLGSGVYCCGLGIFLSHLDQSSFILL